MLHGTEAVIPLAGGAIPVAISGGATNKGDVGSGPAFSKANEFAAQMDKVIKALDDSNKYLSDIYDEISGGATVGGAGSGSGSGSGERVAQEALAEHDHAHPHEPAAAASPELAAQIGKIVMPLEKMNPTSGFGNRMMDGKVQGHGAIDLAGKIGDKVMAPISGIARVLSEKESGGYGNMVEVTDSVTGVKHMLAHLDKSMVKSGDVIKAGQQIGTLGNTGKSTGAHLHHEMRDKQGNKIDPSQFYSGPGFGSTAGGAATGNPQAARRGQKYGATQMPGAAGTPGAPTDMATYMKTVAMLESGGDPNAKAGTSNGKYSSAGGLFQFLESSYEGVTGRKGSGAERFDPKKSTEAMQKLTMMNKGQMEKGLGREVSGEDLYMGHFLGAGGATKFLKAKDKDPNQSAAKFDPTAAASNKSIYYDQKDNNRERSMAEVHNLMTEKYRKQQAAIQGGAKLPDVVAALGTGGMPLAGGAAAPTAVAGTAAPTAVAGTAAPTAVAAAPTAAVPGYAPEQRAQPAAQPTTLAGIAQNLLGGLFGSSGTTAGIAGPTAPAVGGDMAGITAALQAQTAATQSAITSSMENMTTRLVASLGTTGGISGGDPAVPALLGDIVSAQREQTAAINRLISVQTA
jgi:murein DD-endopeptidase MepM/ murein hydrolase activator NlpD